MLIFELNDVEIVLKDDEHKKLFKPKRANLNKHTNKKDSKSNMNSRR